VTPKASSYERGRREGRGAELRAEGTEGVRAVGVSRPVPAGSVSLHFRGIFEPPTMSKYGIPIVSKGQRRINARATWSKASPEEASSHGCFKFSTQP
jgi:hypothetical protein